MTATPIAAAVDVAVPNVPYQVIVGPGQLAEICRYITPSIHAKQIAVVSSGQPFRRYVPAVAEALSQSGLRVTAIELPDGESAKTMATLEQCCRAFAQALLGRDDLVVALGGGVIGDLAGLAAALWCRGVPVIQAPTTLLAQVDAAIGGKTAVDLPEGKNLVGAFHQPAAVVADTSTLSTLPSRHLRSGLGEVAKCGFIADPAILDLLESKTADVLWRDPDLITELVLRCVRVKADLVSRDEREGGPRLMLNYGHTVGHAIEALGDYETFLHGEAVSLGMVFAARLGERLGITTVGLADRTIGVLDALGLPTGGVYLDIDRLWEIMRRDKKARDGVRFVICTDVGSAMVIDQPDIHLVKEIVRSLAT